MHNEVNAINWSEIKRFYQGFPDYVLDNYFNVIFISSRNSIYNVLSHLSGYSSRLKPHQLTTPPEEVIVSFFQKELGLDNATSKNLTKTIGLDLERAKDIRAKYGYGSINLNGTI